MTIQYNHKIASASPLNFFRVMLRWRASVWKAVIYELAVWSICYLIIAFIYDYFLPEKLQELVAYFCNNAHFLYVYIRVQ